MRFLNRKLTKRITVLLLTILSFAFSGFSLHEQDINIQGDRNNNQQAQRKSLPEGSGFSSTNIKQDAGEMPVYGHWKSFTKKDGLPADKAFCVRIDGERVLVGTSAGLAVYEDGKWHTYTTEDGLAYNSILSIDVSELTGDVWIGTMGG